MLRNGSGMEVNTRESSKNDSMRTWNQADAGASREPRLADRVGLPIYCAPDTARKCT